MAPTGKDLQAIDHVAQWFVEDGTTAVLASLDAHVVHAFLAIEGAVRVNDETS